MNFWPSGVGLVSCTPGKPQGGTPVGVGGATGGWIPAASEPGSGDTLAVFPWGSSVYSSPLTGSLIVTDVVIGDDSELVGSVRSTLVRPWPSLKKRVVRPKNN